MVGLESNQCVTVSPWSNVMVVDTVVTVTTKLKAFSHNATHPFLQSTLTSRAEFGESGPKFKIFKFPFLTSVLIGGRIPTVGRISLPKFEFSQLS
eukprot:scaffold468_cov216-Pinguiococcus_pyrenoidosus.AAC.8